MYSSERLYNGSTNTLFILKTGICVPESALIGKLGGTDGKEVITLQPLIGINVSPVWIQTALNEICLILDDRALLIVSKVSILVILLLYYSIMFDYKGMET